MSQLTYKEKKTYDHITTQINENKVTMKTLLTNIEQYKYSIFEDIQNLPKTIQILRKTIDMRIPLTFDESDCNTISFKCFKINNRRILKA